MIKFKAFYNIVEMQDSKANRQNIIRAYGLDQHGDTPDNQQRRASELIKLWTMYSPLIKKDQDYGFPRNIPNIDPRDIYAWSKVSKSMNWSQTEALQNLEAMLQNLKQVKQRRELAKQEQGNYTVHLSGTSPTGSHTWRVTEPHSEGASQELGKGTTWCTASKSTCYFNNYTKDQGVKLIYIIATPTQQSASRAGFAGASKSMKREKYAIAEYPDGRREYFDDENTVMGHDEFMELVIKRFGIETKGWLKEYSVTDQLRKACMRLSQLADQSTSRLELTQAQQNIMDMIMELSEANYKDYEKFREETGMPDRAFIEVSEKHGLTTDTYVFFTTERMNDPEVKTDSTIKANKDFRRLFADTLLERTELSLRGYGEYDHPGGGDDDMWQQVNRTLSYLKQPNRIWELIDYSRHWVDGNWSELHELTLDAFMELGPKQFTESDAGMIHGGLLRFCLYELPDNRFPEMEQYAAEQMQIAARQMGLTHPDDLVLGAPGDNEQMEQWTINMRRAGWIDFANRYNLFVAGAKATNDKVSYIPNNPSSYEKLFDYPMR